LVSGRGSSLTKNINRIAYRFLIPCPIYKLRTGVIQMARFKPGESGNPGGRPKQSYSIDDIFKAKDDWEAKTGKNWLQEMFDKSTREPSIAIALLKKMAPDRVEGKFSFEGFEFDS
jgi:hypothetical protein